MPGTDKTALKEGGKKVGRRAITPVCVYGSMAKGKRVSERVPPDLQVRPLLLLLLPNPAGWLAVCHCSCCICDGSEAKQKSAFPGIHAPLLPAQKHTTRNSQYTSTGPGPERHGSAGRRVLLQCFVRGASRLRHPCTYIRNLYKPCGVLTDGTENGPKGGGGGLCT